MRIKLTLAMAGFVMLTSPACLSQDSNSSWSKTYAVAGTPALTFETSGVNADFITCGKCHEIRIHVEMMGRRLSDYRLDEGQSGDEVHFIFKELPHDAVHIFWHREPAHVTVETPAQLTLHATTSDGNVMLDGLKGELALINNDGDLNLDHVSGDLRVTSGDGDVKVTDSEGVLDARVGDGNLAIEGLFQVLVLRSSDGALDLTLSRGTRLTEPSNIQSSDGRVTIQVPHTFAADLDVQVSDGSVDCNMPLTIEHYQPSGGDEHDFLGKMNGGGTLLTIHTSDADVKIEQF